MAKKSKKQLAADKELLTKMRERFQVMLEADDTQRRDAMEDMKFVNVPGEQWDENMKQERGNRPCYEFNKLRVTCKRIINDMRANRPQGKIRAVEAALKKRCKSDGQKALVKIAEQLLEKAEQGDISALKELGDRMDGRAAQQLIHSGDQDQPIRTVTDVNITSLDEGGD